MLADGLRRGANLVRMMVTIAERGTRLDSVMTAPDLDDDLSFSWCIEDFAVERLVPKATSLTQIWRIASAML